MNTLSDSATDKDHLVLGLRETFRDFAASSIHNAKLLAAKNLEAQLVSLFGLASGAAKNEESMEKVAAIWEVMIGISDEFAREIRRLEAGSDLDKILEIRKICEDRRAMHRIAS